jgi:hypothetical protein
MVMSKFPPGAPRPGGFGNFGFEGALGTRGDEFGAVGDGMLEGSPGKLNALICG